MRKFKNSYAQVAPLSDLNLDESNDEDNTNNKEVFKYYKMFLRKHNITNTNEFIDLDNKD